MATSQPQSGRCRAPATATACATVTHRHVAKRRPDRDRNARPDAKIAWSMSGKIKRRTSPISVANVTATIRSTPRSVCSARMSGASDQAGTNPSITSSSHSTRSFEMCGQIRPFPRARSDAQGDRTAAPATSGDSASSSTSCGDRTTVLKHEGAHLLPMHAESLDCGRPGANEIRMAS